MQVREANEIDLEAVFSLIKELADYENAPGEVSLTLTQLKEDYSENKPDFRILVAATEEEKIVGMAIYYFTYSTWKGRCLYLEDMVVTENWRGNGVGKLLFEKLIRIARENNSKRIAWQVLDWNTPAINFYKKYNAYLDPEWINGKFSEAQIKQYNEKQS